MNGENGKASVIVISGYHQNETFAVGVGEAFLENNKDPRIGAVRYDRKPEKSSNRNLRQFIEKFGSASLPVVLHSDHEFYRFDGNINAIIIYYVTSDREKKKVLEILFNFIFKYNRKKLSIVCDIVSAPKTKHSLVEIEFNPKMGLKGAAKLVKDFSECLLESHLFK